MLFRGTQPSTSTGMAVQQRRSRGYIARDPRPSAIETSLMASVAARLRRTTVSAAVAAARSKGSLGMSAILIVHLRRAQTWSRT